MDQLVLHVGLPKTGSSLLQKALQKQRTRLLLKGWRVAQRGELDAICAGGLKKWRKEPARLGRLDDAIDRISERFPDAKKLVLSHEDLLGHILSFQRGTPYPEADIVLRRLIDKLEPQSVKLVIYLREQARYLESVYLQLIRVGNSLSFDEYMRSLRDPSHLSWLPLLERIESVVGRDAMVVRYFETIRQGAGPFCWTFLADLGIKGRGELGFATTAVNRGYSAAALEVARTANPLLDDAGRKILRAFLDEHFSNRTHPQPRLLTEAQRDELRAALQPDNEALHARYFPDAPHGPFGGTASRSPASAPQSVEQVGPVAAKDEVTVGHDEGIRQEAGASSHGDYSAAAVAIARAAEPLLDEPDQKILRTFLNEHFSNRTRPLPQR